MVLTSVNVTDLEKEVGQIAEEHSAYIGITYLQWVQDNKTEATGRRSL